MKRQSKAISLSITQVEEDDDDFQIPLLRQALRIINHPRPSKRPNRSSSKSNSPPAKENVAPTIDQCYSLDFIKSSLELDSSLITTTSNANDVFRVDENKGLWKKHGGYLCNSIESRLMTGGANCGLDVNANIETGEEEEEEGEEERCRNDNLNSVSFRENNEGDDLVHCPLCGVDISDLTEESRHVHTNHCLDNAQRVVLNSGGRETRMSPTKVFHVTPVCKWLRALGLEKYEEAFVREEIDWDSLQWLTEEDLFSIGVTALGPRKKIAHALSELRKGHTHSVDTHMDTHVGCELGSGSSHGAEIPTEGSISKAEGGGKLVANKLITDYFPGPVSDRKKICSTSGGQHMLSKNRSGSGKKRIPVKNYAKNGKLKDIPLWCRIPGTPFRVDAFKYLRGDCSHWFLTHFHMDHYQGLTRSFCYGKIYCSLITARLVNMKIGIPWDKIQVLPINQKVNIGGIDVTCLDANHCPGSIIILFEPPNGKAVLHTGDFRFSEEMTSMGVLPMRPIHTLILDTTYCNPQYDFPRQEAVIQFVIEAIQAEVFNPKTLFLIGSYTIGKERLFLEVARVLRRKVYVNPAKLRLLECLGLSEQDMQWFTLNERDSNIHVVPMWTLASFKRLKHISNQYASRFSLIVAFSPTGWTFGKGKKKSPGRRWQQGTIIRYEVPYSEHSSFPELREFVKLVSPESIIPSVNNDGPDSADAMISLLLS
ncbi:SAM_1 domain-containing protein/DRMBL domain-containing protein/Lactamase_B_2 domain-containing protein [Cephalotus follicularis]|uniref:SAM_1 domain-containing protein/DRMBL domain-containing protein/Lactamase_B_2 domain-containing protein n=1 Tax=Cephalotus follicularis TaxID=3775 RepID=A0A1Q3CKD6_CEPFO|nr:SAM_1 domain-containing protein/DRMBL domain-containing protein/Lactamase_B_2 domain-containing protein [Cephalotus follicularis]